MGEISGIGHELAVNISSDAQAVLEKTKPDLVFHTTLSSIDVVYPQLELCIEAGANVASTCEELSFPCETDPEIAKKIESKILDAYNFKR